MFFGNGIAEPFIDALATHPPLSDRIRAIDPTFDGQFPLVRYDDHDQVSPDAPKHKSSSLPNLFGTVVGTAVLASEANRPPVIPVHTVVPNVGNPTPSHLRYAEQLRNALPESIKAAAREPTGAVALVYAMLLSCDQPDRDRQFDELAKRVDPAVLQKTKELFLEVSRAAAHAHLPMINLALGSLKQLTDREYENFSETLDWLVNCDGKVELFEFVLQKIVLHHLAPKFEKGPRPVIQYYSIKPLVPDCAVLLSALANVGADDDGGVQKAFMDGAPYLRAPETDELRLLPRDQCGIDGIDTALNRLALSAPLIKKNLLEACSRVVGSDGVILETEAELIRAIADTLDCPIPPFLSAE